MEHYEDSKQYKNAVDALSLIADTVDEDIWDIAHSAGKDSWLEAQDLTTEQMMRKTLHLLADKLAHKIKWREQQNKLDNEE